MKSGSSFLARSERSASFSCCCCCICRVRDASCTLASPSRWFTWISSMPMKTARAMSTSSSAVLVRFFAFFDRAMCAPLPAGMFSIYHSALFPKKKGFFRGGQGFFCAPGRPAHRREQQAHRGRRRGQPKIPQGQEQRAEGQSVDQRPQGHGRQHDETQLPLPHPQGEPGGGQRHRRREQAVQRVGQPPVSPAAQADEAQQVVHRPGGQPQHGGGEIPRQLGGHHHAHISRTAGRRTRRRPPPARPRRSRRRCAHPRAAPRRPNSACRCAAPRR